MIDAGRRRATGDLGDLLSRVVVGVLFLFLAARLGEDFLRTGRITGLLLLVGEFLVAVLTIVRRPAVEVDRTWAARAVTAVSLVGPPMLRPTSAPGVEDAYTAFLSICGLSIIVLGKLSLGRSFGLVPANRGIVCSGLYRVLRHPIYAGYVITHVAFLAAHPTPWNAMLLVSSDAALMLRAVYEERTLCRDAVYAAYRSRVRWRVLPGVF